MKLKKNDLIELKKNGVQSIDAKLVELKHALALAKLELSRGQLKNPASLRTMRRAIAQLMTIRQQLSTTKN